MALDFIIWPEFLLSLDIYNYKSCSAIHNISISFVIKQNNFQSNLFCRNPLVFLSNLNLFSFSREICSLDQHGVWGENKAIVKKEDLATARGLTSWEKKIHHIYETWLINCNAFLHLFYQKIYLAWVKCTFKNQKMSHEEMISRNINYLILI